MQGKLINLLNVTDELLYASIEYHKDLSLYSLNFLTVNDNYLASYTRKS